jgi:hypothetical protein
MSKEPQVSDYEFPQLWENYSLIVQSRQRMLQSAMAYYVNADVSVKGLYDCEIKLGLPVIDYIPQTTQGKNSLTKFNSVCSTYNNVLARFESAYNF